MDFKNGFPWEISGTSNGIKNVKIGTIEYYKKIFPNIFDNDESYNVFVDYYNEHPELHEPEKNEIDLIRSKYVLKQSTN